LSLILLLGHGKTVSDAPDLRLEHTTIEDGENAKIMTYPANYKYTKEHEWIDVNGAKGTVGITDYAQNSLGDIVFVDLPKVGDTLEAGKIFGSVESVKAVSDLYSPVSGTVAAVNEELKDAPEKINADANITWMLKLDVSNASELDGLLSAADYEKFISEETGH
jgi:glycine cleavage system H protein